MKLRLRSAGLLGTMFAVIAPELAITTATVVLTPAVAEAQVGGVHRRTRRRTRRRTAAVVHTADMNQAAAQQQQAEPQQHAEPQQQSLLSPDSEIQQPVTVAAQGDAGRESSTVIDDGAAATVVARAPPEAAHRAVRHGRLNT